METPVAFGILNKAVALGVKLPAVRKVFVCTLRKIVLIDEIVSRVVRRVYVNHLDFAEIGLLQQLQHVKVITLDVQVFCVVEIDALLPAGAKGRSNRRIRQQDRLLLVRPSELIPFLVPVNDHSGQFLPQHIKVDGPHDLAVLILRLGQTVRKQLADFLNILVHLIWAVHFKFIHC